MSELAPVIVDQYLAARAYYGSVVGLFFLEGIPRASLYLYSRFIKRSETRVKSPHWPSTVWIHRALMTSLPTPLLHDYHVSDVFRFLVLLALNILFATQTNEYSTDFSLYGWLTIANAGLALLLAARSNLFSIILRLPSPVILQYHRWIGVATVVHGTIHISYNIERYIATDQLASSFAGTRIQVGLLAWISLVLMFLAALPIVRRRFFEVFYYTHFLFLVFIGAAYYHSTSGPYAMEGLEFMTIGLCLWAADRIIRFLYNFRKITVEDITHFEDSLVKFRSTGMRAAKPGQIVWVQLAEVSLLNWHPFTVANVSQGSLPITTIAIRGLGGYTKAVQQLRGTAASPTDTPDKPVRLRFDGPYGVGRFHWEKQELSVLVAGGIGITPGLAIASHILQNAATGTSSPLQRVYLLWIVRRIQHISWFADELRELHALSTRPNSTTTFSICIHESNSSKSEEYVSSTVEGKTNGTPLMAADPDPWNVAQGKPQILQWLKAIKQESPGFDAAVNVCGPPSLIHDTRRACISASDRHGLFYLEEEVFNL